MARLGIDYQAVEQAAVKLLSQGQAPSVQRIREVLQTGSNSTIARHLRDWRENYAKKTVHHLPPTLPKEMIGAMEVLWHTAMTHAENHLTQIKESLEFEKIAFEQEKQTKDIQCQALQKQLSTLEEKYQSQAGLLQETKTALSVKEEQFSQQLITAGKEQEQLQQRLQRGYEEKEQLIEVSQTLQKEKSALQMALSDESKNYEARLHEERQRQDSNENRWINLLDETKQELKAHKKQLAQSQTQHKKLLNQLEETVQNLRFQNAELSAQAKLDNKQLTVITKKFEQAQADNQQLHAKILYLEKNQKRKPLKKVKKLVTEAC